MTLRRTTATRDPSDALAGALTDSAELPCGARRVLEHVFWRERSAPREGRVIPLSTVRARDPGSMQED